MNIILLDKKDLGPRGRVDLRGTRARHLVTVLRVRRGDRVRVGWVDGPTGEGRVLGVAADEVRLRCTFPAQSPPPPEPVDLLLALPRPKVLRRLAPQLAALGVRHLFLTNAWKVEKSYFASHRLQENHLREGWIEGLQQAGATRLPGVSIHRHLRRLIEDELDQALPPATARLLAHPGEMSRLGQWVPADGTIRRALLAVGPEGGWIDRERELFARHGFESVSLGPRILRVDTACIALLAMLRERLAGNSR